jgi:thiol:disulfide interchange protein DsbD
VKPLLVLTALILALFSPAAAQVSRAVETGHAITRLVAEHDAAAPGTTVWLALVQELEEHWHVYWQNPGDSGLPLDLEWSLPEGFAAGAVDYPLPERLSIGPLVNYGHEGSPTFLIPLDVPADVAPGTTAEIGLQARWLICADICVPEEASLSLRLPIAAARGPETVYAERIEAARRAQPEPAPFGAQYYDEAGRPVLVLDGAPQGPLEFFPYTPSLIEPSGAVDEGLVDGRRAFRFTPGFAYAAAAPERLAGVLVAEENGERVGYEVQAARIESAPAPFAPMAPQASAAGAVGSALLLQTLGLALLGGLILNLMPCVFPIVFLKAAGFAALPRDDRGRLRRHGLLYTAGVLVAFAGIASVLMLLRAGGDALGWGFHLQSPIAVGVFAVLLFLIGLNLAGVFELGTSFQGVGSGLARHDGGTGAFLTGLLAVAVAAPCIGPFLGGAIGLALSQPGFAGMLIFLAIGIGLALPYLLISFAPGVAKRLPRPGPWMVTVRHLFSFAMFGTVVWLAWVLSIQTGSAGVLALGTALVLAALAAWLFGLSQEGRRKPAMRVLAGLAMLLALWPIVGLKAGTSTALAQGGRLEPVPFAETAIQSFLDEGRPVFVDFTAAWCVTCQVNKQTVLETERVAAAFAERGVVYMVADWTLQDPEITRALERHGRAGVPLYLYYPEKSAPPIVLPQLLTIAGVLDVLDEERPS